MLGEQLTMKKTFVLLLFVVIPFVVHSQTFSAGGGLGVSSLIFSERLEHGFSIHFYGSVSLNKLFEVEARPGIFFSKNYFGIETGGYLKIFPINDVFYFVGGLNFHSNVGIETNSTHIRSHLYILPVVGVGLRGLGVKHKALTIELAFQKPFPDGLTRSFEYPYNYVHNFKGILGLNLALIYPF